MRNHFFTCVILLLSVGYASAQTVCAGSTIALQASNPQALSNPQYSMNPGGNTHPTGLFVFSPTVSATYTLYTSGNNASNQFTTTSAVVQVTVYPQPQIAPTVTNYACGTSTNAWNLNLTFNPSTPVPTYTVSWGPDPLTGNPAPPPTWTNNATSMSGSIVPGSYTPIVTAAGGCTASAVFSISIPPAPANFSLTPAPPFVLTCETKSILISATPGSGYSYTFNSNSTGQLATSSIVVTPTNVGTDWSVSGQNLSSGCIHTFTFEVDENVTPPVSTISHTFQSINCGTAPQAVTVTAVSPTVNYSHFIFTSAPSLTWVANSSPAVYYPGAPDTYTYVLRDHTNGCVTIKHMTVTSSSNYPTFGLNSAPGGFTLGCAQTSSATITFTNGQSTIPPGGGAVTYTLVFPGSSYSTAPGDLSTQTSYVVNTPGTYTAVVKDKANFCETIFMFSVLTNTLPPALDTILIPTTILDCFTPQTVLQGFATATNNVAYSWQFPLETGGVGTQNSSTFTVNINPFVDPSQILIATFTLSMQETNNRCISTHTVDMYQNLFPPTAFGAASSSSLTCLTTTVLLTNFSSSNVPPNSIFTTGKSVNAILWEGPSPQVPLANSSSYVGQFPGDYTLTVRDENNGCESSVIIPITDNKNAPLVNFPDTAAPSVLDCGATAVTLVPRISSISGAPLSYSWTVPPPATAVGALTLATLMVQDTGYYVVRVTDENSRCFTFDTMYVVSGSLTASITAQGGKNEGFAPFAATFINESSSSLGNDSIVTIWSFGNDSVVTNAATDLGQTLYTQPGNYTVVAFVSKGFCLDTAYAEVFVDLPSEMVVPNVFTPNGDGVNDYFFLQRSSNLTEISAKIFDRWGNIVYELTTDKMNIEWDGKNQFGKESPAGTYFYIITATGRDGGAYDEKGTLTLIR